MFETRITKLFGIKYPILCGGMYWASRAELVAAVANAGGLGFLTAATHGDPEAVRAEIRKARELTDKPVGLNINLFPSARPQPVEEWARVAVEEKIEVVETSGRSPEPILGILHEGGVKVMHKVPGVRFARTAERVGVDAVCVVGYECGGHPGLDQVTTIVLVPAAVDAVDIPVIAGGGIADGRGLVAALALGADAVLMGTRFMATKECLGHPNWKAFLVSASETDTAYVMASIGNPLRVARNSVAEEVLKLESKGASLQEILTITSNRSGPVLDTGEIESGMVSVGQSVGLIHDVPAVAELMQHIVAEAEQAMERLTAL